LLLLLVLSFIGWAYRTYDRRREIHNFFKDPVDLAWARTYLDKKINFCDAPWKQTVVVKNMEKEVFVSPSGRYEIKSNGRYDEDAYFLVVDNKTSRTLKNVTTPFFTDVNFKWTDDERFLIFTTSITKDDWTPAEIFITDTGSGQTMFLGDSEFYDCGLRHW
jgi:hypothetical protein